MKPEAERLCRRTASPSSSRRTEGRIFKRRQKQRASPLTGRGPAAMLSVIVRSEAARLSARTALYLYPATVGRPVVPWQLCNICQCE
ncbi:hypothetical protein PBY51_015601 [Eleginops maclovinus]|uniref:Uncharacterized protein n=1 Tax=Eleginops maclovinus TaxID=56733 RepID=A0AAN7XNI8_ELEMC|nr:hypothetical protein PBY51_015601 [Eleginops maclovinus]